MSIFSFKCGKFAPLRHILFKVLLESHHLHPQIITCINVSNTYSFFALCLNLNLKHFPCFSKKRCELHCSWCVSVSMCIQDEKKKAFELVEATA